MTNDKLLSQLKKQFGDGKIYVASEAPDVEVISTGSIGLDFATGVGGFPVGSIVEVFGPESIGKTTLSYYMIAEVQKTGGAAAFINLEGRFNGAWAAKVAGVDLDNLLVAAPDPGSEAIEVLGKLVASGAFRIIVFDSVGAITPDKAFEVGGTKQVGGNSGLVTHMINQIVIPARENNCTVVFLNQVRDVMGASVPMLESPGGHALKHGAVIRIQLKGTPEKIYGVIGGKKKQIGYRVAAFIKKNKVAAPKQVAEWQFVHDEVEEYPFGIDRMGEVIDLSLRLGVIRRGGATYYHDSFPDGKINGKEATIEYIRDNEDVFNTLRREVIALAGQQMEGVETLA